MLIINGRKFARNSSEVIETLFQPDGTAIGYYTVRKSGIMLFDLQNNPRAYIVNNARQGTFIVTAAKQKDGRIWYMYALDSVYEKTLGFDTVVNERDVLIDAITRMENENA